MKNFIELISVVLVGQMTNWFRLNDSLDNREIRWFYQRWVMQNIRECQSLCLFNSKFASLCEIQYSREYGECINYLASFSE